MADWKPDRRGANLPAAFAVLSVQVHVISGSGVRPHAIVPLALFEAIRALDLPTDDDLEEFHHDLATKRLGTNRAVAAQIERYAALARADKRVENEEVTAVLRLVGRRADAGLVYAEAGRRAGALALAGLPALLRFARRVSPVGREALGLRAVSRAAADVFVMRIMRDADTVVVTMENDMAVRATPNGAACAFFGSAVAELLRAVTPFEGALLHVSCRGRGDAACIWHAEPAESE
jgi:hypothetical protein